MSKVVGLIGSASGKLGNIVYAVVNGQQTARIYQPNVSNPKSTAQLLQRAKGNLVGRISGIMPASAIVGLSGNSNKMRRARFLANSLKNATATVSNGVFTAKLEPQALILSEGTGRRTIAFGSMTVEGRGVTITMNRVGYVTPEMWANGDAMFVLVAIDPATGSYDFVEVVTANRPDYPETSFTQTIGVQEDTAHDVYVYMVQWNYNDTKSATRTRALFSENAYAANLDLSELVSTANFANSEFLGKVAVN